MQIFVNSVERLNSPVYSAPPCMCVSLNYSSLSIGEMITPFVLWFNTWRFYSCSVRCAGCCYRVPGGDSAWTSHTS